MLGEEEVVGVFMEGCLDSDFGKMGFGVMRYGRNQVCCVVDSQHAGRQVKEVCEVQLDVPVVGSVREAVGLGAEVLVLGVAPSGGRMVEEWRGALQEGLMMGMCLVNGLHDELADELGEWVQAGRWVWDVRRAVGRPGIAAGRAGELGNRRVLMVGTDMAVGKMTAGIELQRWAVGAGMDAVFLATGQIGMVISGGGIALDAYKVDDACGAVEEMVVAAGGHAVVIIEGQGSLLHPGSSATLVLMRGGCPTDLVMCHRAGMRHLRGLPKVRVPPLREVIGLNEEVARAGGALGRVVTLGVSLNTVGLSEREARRAIGEVEDEVGVGVTDVVRFGAGRLGEGLRGG